MSSFDFLRTDDASIVLKVSKMMISNEIIWWLCNVCNSFFSWSRLTARSWTSESTPRPVLTTGLRSSRSHRAGPAWPRHAGSATSPPLAASTSSSPPSLLPLLKMSQQPLPSRGYESAHFAFYEVIIFRHELLAGMGSEQVLRSFFTMSKTKLRPKTCSYHTVKKKN